MATILFAVTVPSTANSFLKSQIKSLIAEGWNVSIVCSEGLGLSELKTIKKLNIHLISMKREPSVFRDLISLYRYLILFRQLSPQIVIGSTPKAALLSMISSRLMKIPIRIYHVRGLRAEGLTGILRQISIIIEKLTINLSTTVLCDSFSLRKALISEGCLAKNSGVVIGKGSCCGVDTEYFREPTEKQREISRKKLNISKNDFIVGFIGRVTKDKGIYELLEAGRALHKEDSRIKVFIVGPVENDFQMQKIGLSSPAITFFSQTQYPRSFYWAFDVFTLPSHREGFPIASLEAQACGLPLVTTTATGCIDSQAPANFDLLIQPKDAKQIKEKILKLFYNLNLKISVSKEARQWVEANFDENDVVRNQNLFLRKHLNQLL
jgi:glycosyltransferase involved in cell wall biosynthesis